jgi:hypothetical protein
MAETMKRRALSPGKAALLAAAAAAVGLSLPAAPAAAEAPALPRAKEKRAEELLDRIHASWQPGFRIAMMLSSRPPRPLESSEHSLREVSVLASHGDRWASAASTKQADVRELLRLGDAATRVCNRSLAAAKSADARMERLAALLGLLGDRESVPILIGALTRAARDNQGHVPYGAATWALWRLGGRRLLQTAADWDRWWQAVEDTFRLPRARATLGVDAGRVDRLARELAGAKAPMLVRERLIVLGPNAVPPLLEAAAAADGDAQYHLAWVIDELGGAARLPAKLRQTYFARRLGQEEESIRFLLLDRDAHRRSLTEQSFAGFCRTALAIPREPDRAGKESDFQDALRGEAADVPGAASVLVEALADRRKPLRRRAAELAGLMARFGAARPAELISALLKRWRAEPGDYAMMGPLVRFDTPSIRAVIREGLDSSRPAVLRDCTRALRDMKRLPGSDPAATGARLAALTGHRDAFVRQYSAEALAARLPGLLVPHFERLARDAKPEVRAACALAMHKLKRPADAALLVELAADRDARVYDQAFHALGDPVFRSALPGLAAVLRRPRYPNNDPCMWAIARIGGPEAAALLIQHAAETDTFGGTIFNALEKVTGKRFDSAREAMIWWWRFPHRPAASGAKPPNARQLAALWERLADKSLLEGYRATQAMVSGGDAAAAFLAAKLRSLRTPADQARRLASALAAGDWATRNQATERLAILGPAAEDALRAAVKTDPSDELKARAEGLLAACALPYPSVPGACRAARAVRALERIGTDRSIALLKDLAAGRTRDHLSTQARAALGRMGRNRSSR